VQPSSWKILSLLRSKTGLEGWDSEHPFRPGATPAFRGQGAAKLGLGPLVQLKRWWKEQPEIEVVAVLAMTVGPRS